MKEEVTWNGGMRNLKGGGEEKNEGRKISEKYRENLMMFLQGGE